MKKSFKSTLSLILVIAMIFSLGISAFAEETYATGLTLEYDSTKATASTTSVHCAQELTVTPNVTPAEYTGKIVWTSSNSSVATIVKSDGTALATEGSDSCSAKGESVKIKALAQGTTIITAKVAKSATANDVIAATINLTVNSNVISSIDITCKDNATDPNTINIFNNTIYVPIAIATASAKTTYTLTPTTTTTYTGISTPTCTWTTPLPATSAIDASISGSELKLTPKAANTSGVSYTVTATDSNASNSGLTRTITMKTTDVTSAKITDENKNNTMPDTESIGCGDSMTLTATAYNVSDTSITPTDPNKIVWESNEEKVATVSGSSYTATVTGVSKGSAKIYAYVDGVKTNEYTVYISGKVNYNGSTYMGTNYALSSIYTSLMSKVSGLTDSDSIVLSSIADTYGSLYLSSGSKISTTNAFATSRTYTMSDFKGMYITPAKTGDYTLDYSVTKNNASVISGTITVNISNKPITAKATVIANGAALGMSETNTYTTTSVQAQLEAAVSNFSYVVFDTSTVTGSTSGTFSAVNGTSYYKTKSSLSTNALLSSVKFTPSASAGTYTIGFTAYDSDSSVYTGTLSIVVNPAEYTFQFGAEGYTFKTSDFIKSTDTDPIKSVSFTLPTSGVLYTNYSYGKGTAVAKSNAFTSSTLGTLTYIPSASYPMDVNISFTATTTAGKTVSGVAKMDYIERTATLKFNDVSASWAIPAVDFCSTWGIATGTGASTFDPNGTMQRGMLVTMLYRVAGQPSISSTYVNPFSDVYVSDYYYNAVIWAYNMGIVKGTSSTTFSPSTAVSRQDIAVMLARFDGVSSYNANYLGNYKDGANVSSYATTAMNWAIGNGIISGSNGYLTPTSTGTRAQVSVMLHRYLAK